ncbi:hypothetical protein [Actinomadura rupiterrae]|uniref:restriction system modified-DNA reader domain-containing protein n=1 Tax=Actinomadura rupiterrae TaxID=559627 RepID=UPI0020A4D017|nr:hypothetical protein [Actinomadura rupiterrae]MCP2342019.1 hypothetical protein [Actinomadura rupiterrae]
MAAHLTDSLSANVVVPETAADPIEIYIDHVALCVAIVEREGAKSLQNDWDVPGVYVLLDPPAHSQAWGAYVGKAPTGIRSRLLDHLSAKDHWTRALLIRRDTKYGFHSAQVGWLEGRLYDLLHAAENAELHNKNRPSDETLPPHDRQMLESCIMPITRILRLVGYDPAPPGETPPLATAAAASVPAQAAKTLAKHTKTKHNGTVRDLLNAGLLAPHAKLVSTVGSWPGEALVRPDGRIEFTGQVFNTLSGAASALVGGAANGWVVWSIETDTGRVSLATLRARLNSGTHHPKVETKQP